MSLDQLPPATSQLWLLDFKIKAQNNSNDNKVGKAVTVVCVYISKVL